MNMKEVIAIGTKKDRIIALEKELHDTYQDVYEIFNFAYKIRDDSSASDIFYSSLFQKYNDKGIFDKLVNRAHYIINSNKNIMNMINLLQRAVYSPFFDKQSETEFLDAFYETVQALDGGVKKLIVYRIKMLAENRFENKQEDLTRQYER